MKSRFRSLWLLLGTAIFLVLAVGCNDTLRQFIIPVPGTSGNPGPLAHAIILSTNPSAVALPGADTHIDVSGDTSAGIVPVGLNPVFLGITTNRAFVINQGDTANGTPPTISTYTALLPQQSIVNTITLPSTSQVPVAGTTDSAGDIFIANSGSNTVDVISPALLAVTATIPVGVDPVMIAGNASNNKIFVVNQGDNTVTEISTIDNTVIKTIPVGAQPIWAVMSTDGLFVFVVNQGDGTVSVIDTSLDIILPCDTTTPSCINSGTAIKVGLTATPSPNFAFYEPTLRRVYVNNTGENSISVIKGNAFDLGSNPQVLPAKIADITLSGTPVSLTALSNGTRAYAALGNCTAPVINHITLLANIAGCTGNQVSVIDVVGLRETGTITVGAGVVSVDASPDASRVYAISANDTTTISDNVHPAGATQPNRTFPTPSIYVIPTSTNVPLATAVDPSIVSRPLPTFFVPQQDPACVPAVDPTFNNKVAQPCPAQTPFVVRTFP
jgi:YVTN family beta-propeller protein